MVGANIAQNLFSSKASLLLDDLWKSLVSDSSSSSSSDSLGVEFLVCFLILGVMFAVLSIIGGFLYAKSMYYSHRPIFTIQKSYTLLLFVASSVRMFFFFLAPTTERGRAFFRGGIEYRREDPLFQLAADLAELLYFVAFSLLGLHWAQESFTINQHNETYSRIVRPVFFVVIGLCCLGEFICWMLLFFLPIDYCTSVLHGEYILEIIMYFFCAFFTAWFASVVYDKISRNPVRSVYRVRKLREILLVSATCMVFLMFHVFTTLVYYVGRDVHKIGFIHQTVLAFICEVLPAVILLYTLYNPPKAQKDNNYGFRSSSEEQALLR